MDSVLSALAFEGDAWAAYPVAVECELLNSRSAAVSYGDGGAEYSTTARFAEDTFGRLRMGPAVQQPGRSRAYSEASKGSRPIEISGRAERSEEFAKEDVAELKAWVSKMKEADEFVDLRFQVDQLESLLAKEFTNTIGNREVLGVASFLLGQREAILARSLRGLSPAVASSRLISEGAEIIVRLLATAPPSTRSSDVDVAQSLPVESRAIELATTYVGGMGMFAMDILRPVREEGGSELEPRESSGYVEEKVESRSPVMSAWVAYADEPASGEGVVLTPRSVDGEDPVPLTALSDGETAEPGVESESDDGVFFFCEMDDI